MTENVVISSTNGKLILTTRRVVLDEPGRYSAIPLAKVASCHVKTEVNVWMLVLAAVIAIAAASTYVPAGNATVLALVVAAVLVVAFFVTRRGTIEVMSSGGSTIVVPTKGMSHDDAKRFTEAVFHQIAADHITK